MAVLYVSPPDDEGDVLVITDDECGTCGWPETLVVLDRAGGARRGCANEDAHELRGLRRAVAKVDVAARALFDALVEAMGLRALLDWLVRRG